MLWRLCPPPSLPNTSLLIHSVISSEYSLPVSDAVHEEGHQLSTVTHTRMRSTCRMAHPFRFKLDLFVLTGLKEKWPCLLCSSSQHRKPWCFITGLAEEQTCPLRADLSSFYPPAHCLSPWLCSSYLS